MLLPFTLHGEERETIYVDPFLVESLHEYTSGQREVAVLTMESGEKWRVLDPGRRVAPLIREVRERDAQELMTPDGE